MNRIWTLVLTGLMLLACRPQERTRIVYKDRSGDPSVSLPSGEDAGPASRGSSEQAKDRQAPPVLLARTHVLG